MCENQNEDVKKVPRPNTSIFTTNKVDEFLKQLSTLSPNSQEARSKTSLMIEICQQFISFESTDLRVIIEGEEFSCHSLVLQCYSKYFERKALENIRAVVLPKSQVTETAFVSVYDWMLSSSDECRRCVRADNILEMYRAAKFLEVKILEEQCYGILLNEKEYNEDSAYFIYLDAKKYNIPEIQKLMLPRIKNFFFMLVSTKDFLDLEPEDVYDILCSNYIRINCEIEILFSIYRWLKHDWTSRCKYLEQLMSAVRFGLMTPWHLVNVKRNPSNCGIIAILENQEVEKKYEEGLSYSILRHSGDNKTVDGSEWSNLGLMKHNERNWTGIEIKYYSYDEFLEFLANYQEIWHKTVEASDSPDNTSVPLEFPPLDLCYEQVITS